MKISQTANDKEWENGNVMGKNVFRNLLLESHPRPQYHFTIKKDKPINDKYHNVFGQNE